MQRALYTLALGQAMPSAAAASTTEGLAEQLAAGLALEHGNTFLPPEGARSALHVLACAAQDAAGCCPPAAQQELRVRFNLGGLPDALRPAAACPLLAAQYPLLQSSLLTLHLLPCLPARPPAVHQPRCPCLLLCAPACTGHTACAPASGDRALLECCLSASHQLRTTSQPVGTTPANAAVHICFCSLLVSC